MKKLFLFSSLVWCVLNVAYAQIDPSIPTPQDLQPQGAGVTILTKQRLDDGTIVIRYTDKQGRTIQRRTHPSKPGEKQEWDEANPPQRSDRPDPGAAAGRVPTDKPGAAAGGLPDTAIGGQTGEGFPGAKPGGALPGKTTAPGGVLPGGAPLGGVPGEVLPGGVLPGDQPGRTPSDKPKAANPPSALDDARRGAEGILPDNSNPAKPGSVLDEAGKAAKKIAEDILKAIKNLVISTAGTGQTIGTIANITVTNNNDFPVGITPQTFYIPSDGKYQSYVARIPDGTGILPESINDVPGSHPNVITIPPDGTIVIPVTGVCTDVYTPPVPSGETMPPITTWVPVDVAPPPIPADPPGVTTGKPPEVILIPIVSTEPVPKFDPTDIPQITTTSGYTPVVSTDPDIIITWPGTNIPVGGVLDPRPDPDAFAPVVVEVLEAIEDAVDVIQQHDSFPTPFANNPPGERDAIIQQTFWIYTSTLTGRPYTKEDFSTNTYRQFENTTGKTVASLKREQKEQVDEGITDFWNAFHATGIVAKVISTAILDNDTGLGDGVTIEINVPQGEGAGYDEVTDTDAADQVDDEAAPGKKEEEPTFKCVCPDTISFTIKSKKGETSNSSTFKSAESDINLEIKVEKLQFGDTLDIEITNVDINCQCAMTRCDVFWTFVTYNMNNCAEFERDGKSKFRMETSPKNAKDQSIFSECNLVGKCGAPGCDGCECWYDLKITFIDSKSKK